MDNLNSFRLAVPNLGLKEPTKKLEFTLDVPTDIQVAGDMTLELVEAFDIDRMYLVIRIPIRRDL